MEIISPLFFLIALCTPLTSSPLTFSSSLLPSLAKVVETFKGLPRGRAIIAGLFLVHYANRSLVSSWRNPARGRMHISVSFALLLLFFQSGEKACSYEKFPCLLLMIGPTVRYLLQRNQRFTTWNLHKRRWNVPAHLPYDQLGHLKSSALHHRDRVLPHRTNR